MSSQSYFGGNKIHCSYFRQTRQSRLKPELTHNHDYVFKYKWMSVKSSSIRNTRLFRRRVFSDNY